MAKFKYFKKATSKINGEIILSADQFRLLSLIDDKKEIGLIARDSGMDLADFKRHLSKLYEMGLIVPVVRKTIQRYSPEFLNQLTQILTYHVGPVSNIIMADILSDMEIKDRKIPKDDLDIVLSKMTDEISDSDQKIEFMHKVKKLLSRT